MALFNSEGVVTTENFMTAVQDFNNASALIERLLGHHVAKKVVNKLAMPAKTKLRK